jgi:hypothetical protein
LKGLLEEEEEEEEARGFVPLCPYFSQYPVLQEWEGN